MTFEDPNNQNQNQDDMSQESGMKGGEATEDVSETDFSTSDDETGENESEESSNE